MYKLWLASPLGVLSVMIMAKWCVGCVLGGRVLCWDSWIWSWRWKEAEINTPRGSRRPTNYTGKTTTTKTTRQRLRYNPKKRQLIILVARAFFHPQKMNKTVPSSTLCDCSSQTIPVFSVSFGGCCCCCCCLLYSYCCCWAILFQKGAGTALLIDIRRRRRRAYRHIQMNG